MMLIPVRFSCTQGIWGGFISHVGLYLIVGRRRDIHPMMYALALVAVGLLLFFFQAEDGIRDLTVTGVQTCALPIFRPHPAGSGWIRSTENSLRNRCPILQKAGSPKWLVQSHLLPNFPGSC